MAPPTLLLNEDARILDGIRGGDDQALVTLYRLCEGPVRRHVVSNNGTQDDADDMLQEALVILWERVRDGRFEYTARLSTFVVGTVKNLWLRRLARARREFPSGGAIDIAPDPDDSPLDAMIELERTDAVRNALQRIGEPCRAILLLFYWEQASMEDIARRLGFANAETAKARKYQCKKSLRQILRTYERPQQGV
jgi:RNA polymerase sigma factor (sigma-70 family)